MALFNEAWKAALLITACVLVGLYFLYKIVGLWAKSTYNSWLSNPSTALDVDAFVDTKDTPPKYLKIALIHKFSVGSLNPGPGAIELSYVESPHMEGLRLTQNLDARAGSKNKHQSIKNGAAKVDIADAITSEQPPVVIGTIRMGFGHHRIAYAGEFAANAFSIAIWILSFTNNSRRCNCRWPRTRSMFLGRF